jgi:hypothetical protein
MSRVLLPLLLLASFSIARGQQNPADSPEQDAKALTAEFKKQARHMMTLYEFKLPERPDVKFELIPEPVLYWTNPVQGRWEGAVFLWLAEGRPAVIANPLHQTDRRRMAHEFHQLTETPLTGLRDGKIVWRTSEPGVTWKPVPGAEAPAATATARGTQMRAISRKFSATKTEPDKVVRNLRLLPTPVYVFKPSPEKPSPEKPSRESPSPESPSNESKVIDGACFLLAQSTDPKVVVLLEARQNGDKSQWLYALARLNQHLYVVSYDDREVQVFPFVPFQDRDDPLQPYTKFFNQLYQELP